MSLYSVFFVEEYIGTERPLVLDQRRFISCRVMTAMGSTFWKR